MQKLYNRYFPTPSFLAMNSFAIDISSDALRYGELIATPRGLELGRHGVIPFEYDMFDNGRMEDRHALVGILKKLKAKEHMHFVRISLYDVFDREELVDSYVSICKEAGLVPLSFESRPHAIARAVLSREDKSLAMIIHFDTPETDLFIASHAQIFLSEKLGISSEFLSKVSDEQKIDSRIFIKDQLNRYLISWQLANTDKKIDRIILLGKGADTVGLREYVESHINLKTEYANVWKNVYELNGSIPPIEFETSLEFAPVIGLALEDYYYSHSENFLPKKQKEIIRQEYRIRFAGTVLTLVSFLSVVSLMLLMPLYFLSSSKETIAEDRLRDIHIQNKEISFEYPNRIADRVNSKLLLLADFPSQQISSFLRQSTDVLPKGISLSQIVYPANTGTKKSLEIHGNASHSTALENYKMKLETLSEVDSVEMPLVTGSAFTFFVLLK